MRKPALLYEQLIKRKVNPIIAIIAATGVSYGVLIVRPIVSASSIKVAPTNCRHWDYVVDNLFLQLHEQYEESLSR